MRSRQQLLGLLQKCITHIEYGMLTTRAEDGELVSRPLQTLRVDDDGTVWFFTAQSSDKVAHIRDDSRIDLTYADAANRRFISMAGNAELIVDAQRATELWTLSQRIYFPQGPADPALVVLKISPHRIQIWDGTESPLGMLRKFVNASLHEEASDLGVTEEIDFQSSEKTWKPANDEAG